MAASVSTAFTGLTGVEVREHEPMSRHTSFGVGGPSDIFAVPTSVAALRRLLMACVDSNQPYLVIGNGTNVIFRDGGFRGVVIQIGEPMSAIRHEGSRHIAQQVAKRHIVGGVVLP